MESAVALYFRLSQEDVDARGNSLKDESNSIQSQRFMLRSFIACLLYTSPSPRDA